MGEIAVERRAFARVAGLLLLFVGAFLGALYAGAAAWGDWEALQFDVDTALRSERSLSTLRCPVLMTTGEIGTVGVVVKNPTSHTITRTVRIHISQGDVLAMREFTERVTLEPKGKQYLSWEIYPEDRVFNLFVLVRVILFRGFSLPSADAACGVMVLDLPWARGGQIVAGVVAASLLCMGVGELLLRKGLYGAPERTREVARSARAIAVLALVAMGAGYLGLLWVGSAALVLLVLLAVVAVGRYVRQVSAAP